MDKINNFKNRLLRWYDLNHRRLPWRATSDPYLIWLSEIILQQTRVDQGLPYYNKFVDNFPTIKDLAIAKEEKVLSLWQGLGYYSRARNLHATAKYIYYELGGTFPSAYEDILKLKGVGPYTAAAIASFAYNEPKAVVDGNVYRVLSRYFGIEEDISTGKGQKYFSDLANELIPDKSPGLYNQAIMEFGSLQCTPGMPDCISCVVKETCDAFKNKNQTSFPVKTKKTKQRVRHMYYIVMEDEKLGLYFKKRVAKDIWQGLFDFPLIETEKSITNKMIETELKKMMHPRFQIKAISKEFKHILSHQVLQTRFIHVKGKLLVEEGKFHQKSKIKELPKPVLISNFLKENYF